MNRFERNFYASANQNWITKVHSRWKKKLLRLFSFFEYFILTERIYTKLNFVYFITVLFLLKNLFAISKILIRANLHSFNFMNFLPTIIQINFELSWRKNFSNPILNFYYLFNFSTLTLNFDIITFVMMMHKWVHTKQLSIFARYLIENYSTHMCNQLEYCPKWALIATTQNNFITILSL